MVPCISFLLDLCLASVGNYKTGCHRELMCFFSSLNPAQLNWLKMFIFHVIQKEVTAVCPRSNCCVCMIVSSQTRYLGNSIRQ